MILNVSQYFIIHVFEDYTQNKYNIRNLREEFDKI